MAGEVRIGTSGWVYPHWRERFYPKGLPQSRWLEFYAERFDTVELNNPFYRQPERVTFERWRRAVPEQFVYAVKLNRFITHMKRLNVDRAMVARSYDTMAGLGPKAAVVLVPVDQRRAAVAADVPLDREEEHEGGHARGQRGPGPRRPPLAGTEHERQHEQQDGGRERRHAAQIDAGRGARRVGGQVAQRGDDDPGAG